MAVLRPVVMLPPSPKPRSGVVVRMPGRPPVVARLAETARTAGEHELANAIDRMTIDQLRATLGVGAVVTDEDRRRAEKLGIDPQRFADSRARLIERGKELVRAKQSGLTTPRRRTHDYLEHLETARLQELERTQGEKKP